MAHLSDKALIIAYRGTKDVQRAVSLRRELQARGLCRGCGLKLAPDAIGYCTPCSDEIEALLGVSGSEWVLVFAIPAGIFWWFNTLSRIAALEKRVTELSALWYESH